MRQQYHDGKPHVIPPAGGWEPHTWYLVDVEVFEGNPRHRALFFSGFTHGPGSGINGGPGFPGNYNGVQALNYAGGEDAIPIHRLKYLRVVRRLFSKDEMQAPERIILDAELRRAMERAGIPTQADAEREVARLSALVKRAADIFATMPQEPRLGEWNWPELAKEYKGG